MQFLLISCSRLLSQTLRDSDTLLCDGESCLALFSEAQSRGVQYSGLLTDARPATTQSYIYIHKTEENGEIRHTFCYCLETDKWKELGTVHGEGAVKMPDPPGSYITSYAEKVRFGIELSPLITSYSLGVGMGFEQFIYSGMNHLLYTVYTVYIRHTTYVF